MTRFAPRLLVLFLCTSALAACASTPDLATLTGVKSAADAEQDEMASLSKTPGDLDSNIHQAQLLRTAGQYDQAIKILSQLMLVASDDPRVVGEYGKTLVQQGRAAEAVQFLSRATELAPDDWTVFSALGVADDQLGDQASARTAYEHALALRPGESSVLNNYALSRMLANDPENARNLIGRAQIAGGAADPKIARNIALVNELAPAPIPTAIAMTPTPAPVTMASARPAMLQQTQPIAIPAPPASGIAPTQRQPVAQQNLAALQRPLPSPYAPYQAVVMQRVPFDPLAGPVKPATHAPRALSPVAAASKPDAAGVAIARPVIAQPAPAKTADARPQAAQPASIKADTKPAKTAKNAVPSLRMAADKY